MAMELIHTPRGFPVVKFNDRNDVPCLLQMSSLATEETIWLGTDNADPRIMVPGMTGWHKVVIPGLLVNDRMHLTRDQVRELLPFLQKFAETGEIG